MLLTGVVAVCSHVFTFCRRRYLSPVYKLSRFSGGGVELFRLGVEKLLLLALYKP